MIPPPHQQAMQKQLEREQQLQMKHQMGRERMATPIEQTHEKQPMDQQQQLQLQQQQLYSQAQLKQVYEAQKAKAKQQLRQQKLYQQQQLLLQQHGLHCPQQQLVKGSKHGQYSTMGHQHAQQQQHQHYPYQHPHYHQQLSQHALQGQQQQYFHSQYFPPVISPPEAFQSEAPFDPVRDAEVEISRRLHAKAAQLYATEPRRHHHEKDGKHHEKKKRHRHVIDSSTVTADPIERIQDSYELCVASDAELHTIGTDAVNAGRSSRTPTTNYFSLPRSHVLNRPISPGIMRPQSTLRRSQVYVCDDIPNDVVNA